MSLSPSKNRWLEFVIFALKVFHLMSETLEDGPDRVERATMMVVLLLESLSRLA